MENSVALPREMKNRATIWSSILTYENLSKRTEIRILADLPHLLQHYNNQRVETTQILTNSGSFFSFVIVILTSMQWYLTVFWLAFSWWLSMLSTFHVPGGHLCVFLEETSINFICSFLKFGLFWVIIFNWVPSSLELLEFFIYFRY